MTTRSFDEISNATDFASLYHATYGRKVYTANDPFQQKDEVRRNTDNTYFVIGSEADAGAKLKFERSEQTVADLVKLVVEGKICISHNRDLALSVKKIRSIT
jgi:hypothetical protein